MTKTDAERILAQCLGDVHYGRTARTPEQVALAASLRESGRKAGTAAFGEVSHTEDSVHAVERAVSEGRQRRTPSGTPPT